MVPLKFASALWPGVRVAAKAPSPATGSAPVPSSTKGTVKGASGRCLPKLRPCAVAAVTTSGSTLPSASTARTENDTASPAAR
jgi:hypothetical protein